MTRLWARLVRWLDRPLPDVGGHSRRSLRDVHGHASGGYASGRFDPTRCLDLPRGPAPGARRKDGDL